MKLLSCFIFAACLQASASDAQLVTLREKNVSLSKVFMEIRKQTDYNVIAAMQLIESAPKVSVKFDRAALTDALNECLKGSSLTYEIDGKTIIIKSIPLPETKSRTAETPPGEIRGKIVNEKGEPLSRVSVLLRGSSVGSQSNDQGEFVINVNQDNGTLVFSSAGYVTQEINIGRRTSINVTLSANTLGLSEIVVIGYGARSKRDITTSISTLSADKIEKRVPSSPELLMQGQMSGVQVIGNQGNPSARPTVRIRGTNTWGISDPLYVIDGIPVKEYGAGIEGQADQYVRGYMNIMSMIDPNDIESISVLKDASAGAIYGVRAANGVVLITTKKGKKGTPVVSLSQRMGLQNVKKKLDLLNTKEYADYNNALYASDPTSSGSRDALNYVFDPSDPGYLGNSPTYDWQTAVRNKDAQTQDYSVNVSGGTDKVDYFVSFGYADQEGVNIDNYMRRYSGSIKLNVNVTDFLRVGVNYRLSTQKGMNFSRSPIDVAQMPAWQPIYDPNGINGYAAAINGYDANGVWQGTKLYGNTTGRNDLGYLTLSDHPISSMRNMGNAFVELEPMKGLTLKGAINIDKFDNSTRGGNQYISSYFSIDGGNPTARGGVNSVGDYERRIIDNFNIIKEFTVNYTKSFGNHNLDVLLNTMQQNYSVDNLNTYTVYVTSTDPNLIGLGGDNQYTSAISNMKKGALQGSLLRVGYNFSSKYYLDVTVRRDGSSRFAPENRWGTFPAISAAWRLTKEKFLNNTPWLDDLKFRAGWGKLGNQEVKDMAFLSGISTAPTYAWGNNPSNPGRGYTNSSATVFGMPNRDLSWETTSTINIGFDAVMFRGLNLSVEYYDKITDGILQTLTLPPSVGLIEQPVGNVAKVQNKGIEVNANYSGNAGELTFSVGGNFTTVRNRVLKLYGGIPMGSIEEGYPLFYIKGFQMDGRFATDGEATAWLANHNDLRYQNSNVRAGDFYFKDLRGAPATGDKFYSTSPDGIIDDYDQVYLGKTIPGYFYGFNLNLGYKGFDFTATFTGVGDVQKTNQVKTSLLNLYTEGAMHTKEALNYWTPSNPNTTLPRLIWGDPASNNRFSNYWIEDADYLRLSNMQIGFTLPDIGIKKVMKSARVYVGASNVFTVTKFKGFDPEDENNPAPRILYFGLNARF